MPRSKWHDRIYQGGSYSGVVPSSSHLAFPDRHRYRSTGLDGNQYRDTPSSQYLTNTDRSLMTNGFTSHNIVGNDSVGNGHPIGEHYIAKHQESNKQNYRQFPRRASLKDKDIDLITEHFGKTLNKSTFSGLQIPESVVELPEPDYGSDSGGESDGGASDLTMSEGEEGGESHGDMRSSRKPKRESIKKTWDVFHANDDTYYGSTSDNSATYVHFTSILKIVFALLCFILVLISATASRIILITMTYFLRPKNSDWIPQTFLENSIQDKRIANVLSRAGAGTDVKWIWALLLLIIVPYFFNFCSALWKVIFKTTGQFKISALLLTVLLETIHSISLCSLVFYVMPRHDPIINCCLLSATIVIPATLNIAFPLSRQKRIDVTDPEDRKSVV